MDQVVLIVGGAMFGILGWLFRDLNSRVKELEQSHGQILTGIAEIKGTSTSNHEMLSHMWNRFYRISGGEND